MKNTVPTTNPSLDAAMAAAQAALDDAARIDAAYKAKLQELADAKAASEASSAKIAEIETSLALEVDDAKIAALEKALKASIKAADEAHTAIGRSERTIGAFRAKAAELDDVIAGELAVLDAERQTHIQQVEKAFHEELAALMEPIMEALCLAHAMHSALQQSGGLSAGLEATRIHSFLYGQPDLLPNLDNRVSWEYQPRFVNEWRDQPELVALHAELAKPRELVQRLRAHRPAEQRLAPPAAPYVRCGVVVEA